MATLAQKREIAKQITENLSNIHRKVENVGLVFFIAEGHGCVQRDFNYRYWEQFGLLVNIIDYQCGYFSGSEEKARLLQEEFGGEVKCSEYAYYANNPCPIWMWESPKRKQYRKRDEEYPDMVDLNEANEILAFA